jgi:hypothetical protein
VRRDTFCSAVAEIYCSAYETCCPVLPADCHEMLGAACEANAGAFLDDEAISFDADEADDLLEELRAPAMACDVERFNEAALSVAGIRRVFHGDALVGEPCSHTTLPTALVCDLGLACDGSTCQPLRGAGGPCVSSLQCPSDQFCGAAGTCVTRLAGGVACMSDFDCQSGSCVGVDTGRRCSADRSFCF